MLEAKATDDVKHRVAKTIVWQEEQMLKAYEFLQHLISSKHFDVVIFYQDAFQYPVPVSCTYVCTMLRRLNLTYRIRTDPDFNTLGR